VSTPLIAITPGEPAGIGPDILIQLLQQTPTHHLVAVCDPNLLEQRAKVLGLPIQLITLEELNRQQKPERGVLAVMPQLCERIPEPGKPLSENASYVLACLDRAMDACLSGQANALVTGPINKHVIYCGVERVVMMLAIEQAKAFSCPLRVALHTTHMPLRDVPAAITHQSLVQTIKIVNQAMQQQFKLVRPRILVCGLNPHAGEAGSLGGEEQDIINPCMAELRKTGIDVSDALPADTVFTARHIEQSDVIVAMYHDQGLAPLKSHGFGSAVNITLGLPIVRSSVDHGTAFDLAGTGRADYSSLQCAINTAASLVR